MIQVTADGAVVYDSRMEDLDLAGLKITTGLNVGGSAEIILPQGHPAYDYFTDYKTNIHIYRDNARIFRGRVIFTSVNFYGQKTVTCEGELCFLRDTINRPYLWQATPRSCFVTLINAHNAQVADPEKAFEVGDVTVTDPNDWIRLESESAETTLATLNKLIERCGGYITFTDGAVRRINWLSSLDAESNQVVEFGENLLDFSRTGSSDTSLATGIIPYGAKLKITDADGKETTSKERLTIASVNGGKDYILADDAVAVRGVIMTTATWDDVEDPNNLLAKARLFLEESKQAVNSIELTAIDLSYLDEDLDRFKVGDLIRVVSHPHGVNDAFLLTTKTEDLLNPAQNRIVLGKDLISLSGSTAAGDRRRTTAEESAQTAIAHSEEQIAAKVEAGLVQHITASEQHILLLVGESYATKNDVSAASQTLAEQVASLSTALSNETTARAGMINKENGVVIIGGGAPVRIDGSELNFTKEARFLNGSGVRIADKDGNSYYVLRVDNANSCVVGNDYTNLYLRGKEGVYLYKGGAAVTSDRREKNSIEKLPEAYEAILDKLEPMRFRYDGKGDRYHVGFIAQDVDEALAAAGLTRDAFGGFVDLKGDGSELALAYDEFIGLLLQKQRRLEKRLQELEEKMNG